ncbi:MAG: Mur ligase, partial [Betaproteobacteria bacterium]|nr:Mur ligase [Betaproteobacteria bacterium]
GSNGKTTTTRAIAAMLERSRAEWTGRVGLCGTGGVVIGGEQVTRGDYSGPAGARTVLRDPRVAAAVLETARGGILRRGLAVEEADVAVVTNVSADHFGEYGIDTLDDIAEAKLAVARPLGDRGKLVMNADDEVLMRFLPRLVCRVALFSLRGVPAMPNVASCVLEDGALILRHGAVVENLGPVAHMPLTVGGAADYNIANLAAAALAAHAMGVHADAIRAVLLSFGESRADNPGRFERWTRNGVNVVMDYAHNPDGLQRLLRVCASLRAGDGRLLLLLGQAGNRTDTDIRDLARVAASFAPERVVIKELPEMLRGRAPGEVPGLLYAALTDAGISAARIERIDGEVDAALHLLNSARSGDVVVLPVHQKATAEQLASELDAAHRS